MHYTGPPKGCSVVSRPLQFFKNEHSIFLDFFNAKTYPIYLGYVGLFFSGLKLILPDPESIKVQHRTLEYKKTALLIIIAIIYGATILKIGYFLTTSFFLFGSYYFLGERRWILMFLLSFPFVSAFMYLLHGVLEIYLRDPFLKLIGVMG